MKNAQASAPVFGNRLLSKKCIARIMKVELGMKFKKARVVNHRANLAQQKVQRQFFAMKLIVMMHSGKRVINIDESTMDQGRFVR